MAKPTTLPQWADNDIVNPTSGQNNVVVPGATYKTEGWGFDEIPPRQYDNWFKRWAYRWIEWLDTVFGDNAALDQDCSVAASPAFANVQLNGTGALASLNTPNAVSGNAVHMKVQAVMVQPLMVMVAMSCWFRVQE